MLSYQYCHGQLKLSAEKSNCNTPTFWKLKLIFVLIVIASSFTSAYAVQSVKIGVLAFRPKPQTLAQWQPLAIILKQAIPEYDFVVEAFTLPEIKSAVEHHQLDFVLTNPGHYVILAKRFGLSSPLATLVFDEGGQSCRVFGGVIFTRANEAKINLLADIENRTIAITGIESLGGYQMQAYEMKQSGFRMPQDSKLLITGMPQDKVVTAVLEGRADIGFLRTGVLEALVRERKLNMANIKIINRQNPLSFPMLVSTRLYPEWPFAALPHVNESLARHVAATLFLLENNSAATKSMGIHGFAIPEDYMPVADILRDLRMPPFESAPQFTLKDVLNQYSRQILAVLIVGGLIISLVLRLLWTKRRLVEEHGLVVAQQIKMQELAFYDTLTTLPNRRLLNDRLSQAMAASNRSSCYGAIIFIDLDNFKPLNDTYGHATGDLLLIEAANRLKNCMREMDTVARFGGDEFVVLLSELDVDKNKSIDQASTVAEKIRTSISNPFILKIKNVQDVETYVEHRCTASMGVTLFINHEATQDEVLKWADAAMYQAKEDGRNLIRFNNNESKVRMN